MTLHFMTKRSALYVLLVLVMLSVLAGCTSNPFGRGDRRRPPQDQSQDLATSDTPLPPTCASAADCGIAQNNVGRPPMPLTYSAQIRKQLEAVGKELALTPKQTVLWDNYMSKIDALITDQANPDKRIPILESAPRQIQRKLDISRNRYTAIEEISEASINLYQSLNDDQKKTADRIMPSVVPMLYASLGDPTVSAKSNSTPDPLTQGTHNGSGGGRRRGSGSWGGSGTSY